jgi:predicted  nucleic acid-binding Zn-ribbon protein
MCYTAGDAMVSASMIAQLKEVTDAGFQEDTNVLLFFDPNCNGRHARIFDVNHRRKKESRKKTIIGDGRDPFVRNIAEDCDVQDLQQLPAPLTLRYFLEYARAYYPARNYMLFLMGHGIIVGNDQFLPDDDDGSSVTLLQLGKILKNFGEKVRATDGEFHLVGFHSCGMSSVELAFELQGSAQYMMGTQGAAFPGSWPYRQLLKKIFNAISSFPKEQAATTSPYQPSELVKEILLGIQNLSFYNANDFFHAGISADLTMCSLNKDNLDALQRALQGLVGALVEGLKTGAREAIQLAHLESQSYFAESYTDLCDFCECLQQHCPEGGSHDEIGKACQQVRDLMESERYSEDPKGLFNRLVVFSDFFGPAYQHSNGLSIYFPWQAPPDGVLARYENYAFTGELGSKSWINFLDEYFFRTKRPMKGESPADGDREPRSQAQPPLRDPFDGLSDEKLLRLGAPPRHKPATVAKRITTLQTDVATLRERIATLKRDSGRAETKHEPGKPRKELGSLSKELGSLAKELGSLADEKELPSLAKELGSLSKELGSLADEKELGSLAKEVGSLSKEVGSLADEKELPSLAKELGSLSKELGSLANGKELPSLAKELGSLSKELGSLANGKELPSLAKELGSLSKELGSLAKELATLGFFGITAIKNFDVPRKGDVTSRPKGNPNQGRRPRQARGGDSGNGY